MVFGNEEELVEPIPESAEFWLILKFSEDTELALEDLLVSLLEEELDNLEFLLLSVVLLNLGRIKLGEEDRVKELPVEAFDEELICSVATDVELWGNGGGTGVTAVEPALRLVVRLEGKAVSSITHAKTHSMRIVCTNNWSIVVFKCILLNANEYE